MDIRRLVAVQATTGHGPKQCNGCQGDLVDGLCRVCSALTWTCPGCGLATASLAHSRELEDTLAGALCGSCTHTEALLKVGHFTGCCPAETFEDRDCPSCGYEYVLVRGTSSCPTCGYNEKEEADLEELTDLLRDEEAQRERRDEKSREKYKLNLS